MRWFPGDPDPGRRGLKSPPVKRMQHPVKCANCKRFTERDYVAKYHKCPYCANPM